MHAILKNASNHHNLKVFHGHEMVHTTPVTSFAGNILTNKCPLAKSKYVGMRVSENYGKHVAVCIIGCWSIEIRQNFSKKNLTLASVNLYKYFSYSVQTFIEKNCNKTTFN